MILLLPQAIDATATAHPERTAMCFLDRTLTYGELAAQSNALPRVLADNGVRRGDRVGIYMDKCLESPVALYGIMKAGAAYVPLDPAAPPERLEQVVRDCAIRHLVTADDKRRGWSALLERGSPVECLVGVSGDGPARRVPWAQVWSAPCAAPPAVKVIEDDLAYVIYTSGSTGQPKGIMHTHRSGLSFSRWAAAEYGLCAADRLSNHAPLHFDLSILDFFAGAVAGSTTVIIPEEYTKLPASYSKLIADQRITVLYTVPFALIQLVLRGMLEERDFSALRWIIFGGEPFPTKHLRALMTRLPHVRFDNIYGPAETNGVTHYVVPELAEAVDTVPIGRIAAHAEALVVDEHDNAVNPGDPGELLVRSPTMMQGYWARPDLNARAFYRRAPAGRHEQVFYRTGDLVTEGEDGVFRFLGRQDRQVKVRGFRVELDEIEAALSSAAGVEEAAAFALPDHQGSQAIHGAVTLRRGVATTTAELAAHLRARLPKYAIPARLRIHEHFPRTSTGKIDRRELRARVLGEAAPPSAAAGTASQTVT